MRNLKNDIEQAEIDLVSLKRRYDSHVQKLVEKNKLWSWSEPELCIMLLFEVIDLNLSVNQATQFKQKDVLLPYYTWFDKRFKEYSGSTPAVVVFKLEDFKEATHIEEKDWIHVVKECKTTLGYKEYCEYFKTREPIEALNQSGYQYHIINEPLLGLVDWVVLLPVKK